MNLPASWAGAVRRSREKSGDAVVALGIAALLLWYALVVYLSQYAFVKGIDAAGGVFGVLVLTGIPLMGVTGIGVYSAVMALATRQRHPSLTLVALMINCVPWAWVLLASRHT